MQSRLPLPTAVCAALVAFVGSLVVLAGFYHPALAAPPAPHLAAVSPSIAPNDLDTTVVVSGSGFVEDLSGSQVITPAVVRLGSTVLKQTGFAPDGTAITVTIPWGLLPGVYPLTETNPDGQSSSLAGALTVTQGVGQWVGANLFGGTITDIQVDANSPSTLYANAGTGIFRSQDAGTSWQLIFPGTSFTSIVLDTTRHPSRVYLADSQAAGVYQSDDAGSTWSGPLPAFAANKFQGHWHDVALLVRGGVLYAGVREHGQMPILEGGIYRYDEAGQDWLDATNGITDTQVSALALDPADGDRLYAGTANGNVFRRSDNGSAWVFIGQPDVNIHQLALNPHQAGEVWACGGGYGQLGGKLARYDGHIWSQVDVSNENPAIGALAFGPGPDWAVYAGGGGGLYHFNGAVWDKLVPQGYNHDNVWAIGISPSDPAELYIAYGPNGVFRSLDHGSGWQATNQGLAAVVPASLASAPGQPGVAYAAVGAVGVYKTVDGGAHFVLTPGGNYPNGGPRTVAVDPFTPERVYAGLSQFQTPSQVNISVDGGAVWHPVDLPQPTGPQNDWLVEVMTIATSPLQAGHLALGAVYHRAGQPWNQGSLGGVYTSDDSGASWSYRDISAQYPLGIIGSIVYHPGKPNVLFAASQCFDQSQDWGVRAVLKSTDGGQTWSPSGSGLSLADTGGCGIQQLAIEPRAPYRMFASYGGGLYISSDEGVSWQPVPNNPLGPGMPSFWKLLYTGGSRPALYASSTNGLYRTTDGAQHWERASGLLGRLFVQAIAATATADRTVLYAATIGGWADTSTAQQAGRAVSAAPVGAGVYRFTSRTVTLYVPLLTRKP